MTEVLWILATAYLLTVSALLLFYLYWGLVTLWWWYEDRQWAKWMAKPGYRRIYPDPKPKKDQTP